MGKVQYFTVDANVTASVDDDWWETVHSISHGIEDEMYQDVRYGDDDFFQELIGDIGVVSIEITRPMGIGGSEAVVEAVVDEPEHFEFATKPGATVEFAIEINDGQSRPGVDDKGDARVFTGTVVKVTQTEDGLVTITAQDARRQLVNHTVRLDTEEEGIPGNVIVREVLINDGPFDDDQVVFSFDDGFSHPSISNTWGSDSTITIHQVLKDVARLGHYYIYTDQYNRIHVTDMPDLKIWEPQYLTEINVGNNSSENERVIVEAPRVDSTFGGFRHNAASGQHTRAEAKDKESMGEKSVMITDQNVQSVETASNTAVDQYMVNGLTRDSGTIVSIGLTTPQPFDTVRLTNLPDWAPLPEGTYSISELVHRVDASNGFTTEAKLGKNIEELYERLVDTHGVAHERANKASDKSLTGAVLAWGERLLFGSSGF